MAERPEDGYDFEDGGGCCYRNVPCPLSSYVPIRRYIGTQLVAPFGELMEFGKGSPSGGSGTIW